MEVCTQSVTGLVLPGTDVQAGEQDGVVVVPALPASQGRLPLAETVQRVVSMVVDRQAILRERERDRKREPHLQLNS